VSALVRRTTATVDWYQFDGRFGNLTHGMPNEPALLFKCYDGAVDVDAGIWRYCLVEFASMRHRTVRVDHLGFVGIIRDQEGDILSLTTVNPGERHG
jgi:hypothetical protein